MYVDDIWQMVVLVVALYHVSILHVTLLGVLLERIIIRLLL